MAKEYKTSILSVYDESGNKISIPAVRGKSAYEYATENGYTGSEEEYKQDMNPDSINNNAETFIISELAKRNQAQPIFVNSAEEMTDTTKLYVLLPDCMIYAYMLTKVESGPTYRNWLLEAVNSNNEPYRGDNGEIGYRAGYRVDSSGAEVQSENHTVTGFLPIKSGDIVRVKGFTEYAGGSNIVHHYNADFTKYGNASYPNSWTDEGNGIKRFTVGGVDSTAYIRIAVGTIDSNAVVTRNEEITEGSTEIITESAWTSTGHAFVPADYEDRIIKLEQKSTQNTVKIAALEKATTSGTIDETEAKALERIKMWDKPVYDAAPITLLGEERNKAALTSDDKTIAAIYAKYRALMAANPKLITETNMGPCTASDAFPAVDMLRFDFKEPGGMTQPSMSDAARHETKPKLIFMSGVHKEWAGVWGLYYALEEIVTNPDFDDIRRNAHIIVIPCANPFCLTSQTAIEGWQMSHVNANGIAIHNNFGVDHRTAGAVGEYNYGGTTPYSELETQYIDAVVAENSDAIAFVTCHNNDYSTYYGSHVIWASSATYHMCNVTFRLVDKMTKAWIDKYGQTLKDAIDEYKINMDEDEYRLGRATMSSSYGTEQKNATKYGIQATNLEIPRMMYVFSGKTDCSSEVMTRGAEVYANFMRTLLWNYDHNDKQEYAPNLPWSE